MAGANDLGRRAFVGTIALAPAAWRTVAAEAAARVVRFGVISDVHQDLVPDAVSRLTAFAEAMRAWQPDFVIHCGDFCQPHERNRAFLEVWNSLPMPHYAVLGNHDMDGGYQREQTVAYYGMPAAHYSFEAGPLRGIVLDGNEPGGQAKGYARYIGAEQRNWLAAELARDPRPALVFCHQPPEHPDGLENGAEVRAVLDAAEAKRPGSVAAVFAGHLHQDYARVLNQIPYLQVNSSSYLWLGSDLARETWPPEVHAKYRHLASTAGYRDPLWAEVTVDLAAGTLTVAGRASAWVGPDPWTRGASEQQCLRDAVRPAIEPRALRLAPAGR